MHQEHIKTWQHEHTFAQDQKKAGESKTFWVIGITAAMMGVEITIGILSGSMALLADGLHMASHAVALSINAFAYIYARRHASDSRFSFGTGKVNALGGFTGAVLLGVFAVIMAWESLSRLISPVHIAFDQAIGVAVIGLLVNGISMFVLGHSHEHKHSDHEPHSHHDHNLKSAYFHVLADALTSLLAIFALLTAKYYGLIWMDPLMGIVGSILVSRWALGLLKETGYVLLDKQGPKHIETQIREAIEQDGDSTIADLHLWAVGPDIYSVILSVVAQHPRDPDHYKKLIPIRLGLAHITVEVFQCKEH